MGTSHSRLWTITIPLSLTLLAFAHYRWRQRRQRKIEHYEQVGHVTGLFIYPVKSCAGISLETADCLTEGLQFDRSVYLCFYLLVCSNVMDVPLLCKSVSWICFVLCTRTFLLCCHFCLEIETHVYLWCSLSTVARYPRLILLVEPSTQGALASV